LIELTRGGRNYEDSTDALVQLTQGSTDLTILRSTSQAHSADLIYNLARKEMLDGGGMVGLASAFLESNVKKVSFLRALPGMSIVAVLVLLSRFENLRDIINTTPTELEQQSGLSSETVMKLQAYFRTSSAFGDSSVSPVVSSPTSAPSSPGEDAAPEDIALLRPPKFLLSGTTVASNHHTSTSTTPAVRRGQWRGRGAVPAGSRGRGGRGGAPRATLSFS